MRVIIVSSLIFICSLSLSAQERHFFVSFDRGAYWYSADEDGENGRSPLEDVSKRFDALIDSSGRVVKGKAIFFGPRLYYQFNDAEGFTQWIEIGLADPKAIPDEDPAYAYRRVDLRDGLKMVRNENRGLDLRFSGLLPAGRDHPETKRSLEAIDTYERILREVRKMRGQSLTLDPDSKSTEGAFPIHLDYFGFSRFWFDEAYEMGGYWYLSANSNRIFADFSPQGFSYEPLTFRVDFLNHGEIRLIGYRPGILRARELVTNPFKPGSETIHLRAQKYSPLLGWPAVQRANFCSKISSLAAKGP